MATNRPGGRIGWAIALGLLLGLVPSTGLAQDDAPLDTGWDLRSLDLGASLEDPDAVDAAKTGSVLRAAGAQGQPERSPDGTRLAYVSSDAADPDWPSVQVWIQEPDGTRHRVTDHDDGADQPTWSPDGTRLAFVSRSGGIYTIGPDGDDQRTLVAAEDASSPDWSPDGRHVVFERGDGDGGEIWTVNVRTGKLRQLTRSEPSPRRCRGVGKPDPTVWAHLPVCQYMSSDPAFSPDGAWIAFLRHEDLPGGHLELEDTDLWLMHPDGTGTHRAVEGEGEPIEFPGFNSPDGHFQGPPAWSPDGRYLALAGGHCDCLLIVDVSTGTPRQVRHQLIDRADAAFDWGADGTFVFSWADPTSSVWDVD